MIYTDGFHMGLDYKDWAPNFDALVPLHEFAHSIGLGKKNFYDAQCYPHYRITPLLIMEHISSMTLISSSDFSKLILKPGGINRHHSWHPTVIFDDKIEYALAAYDKIFKTKQPKF